LSLNKLDFVIYYLYKLIMGGPEHKNHDNHEHHDQHNNHEHHEHHDHHHDPYARYKGTPLDFGHKHPIFDIKL
jgi:hypothetical protein